MKIAIVTAGVLPVPPVKGGAVENLIYSIITENEKALNPISIDVYGVGVCDNVTCNNINTKYKFINKNLKHRVMEKIHLIDMLKKISTKFMYYPYLNEILKIIASNDYDYIVIENRPQFVLPIYNLTKGKIILHIHNDYLCGNGEDDLEIINACNKVVVVSNYMKDKMVKYFKGYEEKIYVLYNGIDVNRFNKKLKEEEIVSIRKRYGIRKNDFVIIFTGRLIEQKGILQLLQSVKKINGLDDIKVLIVGSSWYSNNLETEYINKLKKISEGIKDKIIFTGYIDYNYLNNLYDISNIAVLPSMWEEPLGMVVLEAMSMKLPVISTKSGGIVEVIREDKTGFLVDRDDNLENNIAHIIEKLYNDEQLCNNIGISARNIIKNNFTTKIYYDKFVQLLYDKQ